MKTAKSGHFCIQPDTPTPRRRSARLGIELRLGGPEPRNSALSSPLRRSNAPPRLTPPPRSSIASPRRTYKSYFVPLFR